MSVFTVLGECHILSHIWFYQMDVVKHFELLMSLGLWGAITMKKTIKLCYDFIQTKKNRENKIFKAFIAYSQASLINLFFLVSDVICILLLQFLISKN